MRKLEYKKPTYPCIKTAVKIAVVNAESLPPPGAPVLVGLLTAPEQQNLTKRARAKYFSYALAKELALCDSKLQSSYYRTLTCCSELTQQDNKVTARYCGARWCLVCNRIRTARMISKYEPHLLAMHQPHFVTLTIPSVIGEVKDLKYTIDKLQKYCRRAADRFRKYGIKFKGFRKIEITYNTTNGYHPHIHFITDGYISDGDDEQNIKIIYDIWKRCKFSKRVFTGLLRDYNAGRITASAFKAELLRQAWRNEFKETRACAQDVRPATLGSLKELFKYSAKIVTKNKGKTELVTYEKTFSTRDGEQRTVTKKNIAAAAH